MKTCATRFPAAALLLLAAAGCSSNNGLVTQKGRTVQYLPCQTNLAPVAGATVTVGSQTATTAKDGTYSIMVPSGTPFTMTVEKTTITNSNDPTDIKYVKLIEAQDTVTASYDRGDTRMLSVDTATLLSSAIQPPPDTAKALLTIELVKTGNCADVTGTTVKLSPSDAKAVTLYPASCISPYSTNTSATKDVFPAVVVYDLSPGTYTVSATSPNCTQVPYPYTDPKNGLTYDGTVTTEGGTGTSFTRIFLK